MLFQLILELKKLNFGQNICGVFENAWNPHTEVADRCHDENIDVALFPCRGKFSLATILRLRNYLKDNNIEIIHSHGYKSNFYAFCASVALPVRLVSTCHNWLGDSVKNKFYASLDRFILRHFDKVVAVSGEVNDKIIESGIAQQKVELVHNGIYIGSFSKSRMGSEIKKEFGISDCYPIIGTVGRLSREKGHRHLLNIASGIIDDYPKAVFLIIGDGDLRDELENEFGSSAVIFTGIRRDVSELYQAMDFFVLPSLTEGLPMVLLEAMASFLPVVATKVGDVPRVVTNRHSGYLCEAGNEKELDLALRLLITDRNTASMMGTAGREKVKNEFSSRTMAQHYIDIYLRL